MTYEAVITKTGDRYLIRVLRGGLERYSISVDSIDIANDLVAWLAARKATP